jgi:hypothetical protein
MIGYIGNILLTACGAPEAYKAFKTKQCTLTWSFLFMCFVGEVLTLAAIINDAPLGYLLLNYGANIFFISIMLHYKIRSINE